MIKKRLSFYRAALTSTFVCKWIFHENVQLSSTVTSFNLIPLNKIEHKKDRIIIKVTCAHGNSSFRMTVSTVLFRFVSVV